MSANYKDATRPSYDPIIQKITDYVLNPKFNNKELALDTARLVFFDSLGCALLALNYPACTKMLGPVVPGAQMEGGIMVPGTNYQLDPVMAAFNYGTMVRWLDFNDTWLAAEWGHPSDNLGAIWSVAQYKEKLTGVSVLMSEVAEAMIMAHEIQGILALKNSFNRVGLDHVMLVRIASTAVSAKMLGLSRAEILAAVSHAWIDGSALRTYRHAPNTGSRKSWAAGDASSRGVRLALIASTGEMGYPSAVSVKTWGFSDVCFQGNELLAENDFSSYVMENVLFKVNFPAEFHAQTAVECAIKLHQYVKNRISEIKKIVISTQESALRIIDKVGTLNNPADRDHCIQYMIAVPLLYGNLTAGDYEDDVASNPVIDQLRSKMQVVEDERMSQEYLEPNKRAIGNSIQIFFNDDTYTEKITIDYPIGHQKRRQESIPFLKAKFIHNLETIFSSKLSKEVQSIMFDEQNFQQMTVGKLSKLLFTK